MILVDYFWWILYDNFEIEEIIIRLNSKGEVKNLISCLKDGKVVGVDDIVVELKVDGIMIVI